MDNFVIQSSQSKIIEKKVEINIFIPKFTELDTKFFNLPNFKIMKLPVTHNPEEHYDEVIIYISKGYLR